MTTDQPAAKPYGNGITEPIHPIDPDALEAAVNRFEAWLAFAAVNRPGKDHLHDVSYESAPIGDADLRILLVDYRHHRPTQWAYDRACEALNKQRDRAEKAEAEVERLTEQGNRFAATIRTAGEMVANRDDQIARLTRNQAKAAHDLDMWLNLHETEPGSARVASALDELKGPDH